MSAKSCNAAMGGVVAKVWDVIVDSARNGMIVLRVTTSCVQWQKRKEAWLVLAMTQAPRGNKGDAQGNLPN